jgi:hypothetical protein
VLAGTPKQRKCRAQVHNNWYIENLTDIPLTEMSQPLPSAEPQI